MGKGRSQELIELRNIKLCKRWFYWTEVQRLRFDDTLKVLSREEFFISEKTIENIIRDYAHKVPGMEIKPVPKVKKPKITAAQLCLFTGE